MFGRIVLLAGFRVCLVLLAGETCLIIKVGRLERVLFPPETRVRSSPSQLMRARVHNLTRRSRARSLDALYKYHGEPGRQCGYLPYLCACGIREHLTCVLLYAQTRERDSVPSSHPTRPPPPRRPYTIVVGLPVTLIDKEPMTRSIRNQIRQNGEGYPLRSPCCHAAEMLRFGLRTVGAARGHSQR
jgi:hypothetical protein